MRTTKTKPRLVNADVRTARTRWRPELEVGVKEIDQQHKALVGNIAGLQKAIKAETPKVEVEAMLANLVRQIGSHFAWEERLMGSCAYEGFADHQRAHAMLLEQIRGLHHEFLVGDISPSRGMGLFLKAWAEHHIAATDKPFAEFLLQSDAARKRLEKTS